MLSPFVLSIVCGSAFFPVSPSPPPPTCAQQTPLTPPTNTVTPKTTNAKNAVDVTKQVAALMRYNSLDVVAETALAGTDPARKIVKKLVVIYSVGAQRKVAVTTEGDTLRLAAPPGEKLVIEKAIYGDIAVPVADVVALLTTKFPMSSVDAKTPLPLPFLQMTLVQAVKFEKRGSLYFADFGADAYGNLQITFPVEVPPTTLSVRLGEKLNADGQLDRSPSGSINFREIPLTTRAGQRVYQLQIPTKPRHLNKAAVHPPLEIGEITPFRYAEIENSPVALNASNVRQLSVHTAFDDNASSFHSSDDTLNAVWNLCKHTMKATTAFGVFIDGERERIPYEADAYINELSYFASDPSPAIGRATFEHLLAHPTWPTEWSFHMPMLAEADYQMTGDTLLLTRNYDVLKSKLMMDKTRQDGLLSAPAIVDWPDAERDGYASDLPDRNQGQQVGPPINTVSNAFYYHALQKMVVIARALHKEEDARLFQNKAAQLDKAFNATFFDARRGVYIDGEGSTHASLHANLFPLAFGLVPVESQKQVADFVQSRGMACSVYGAQYLLEALYLQGKEDYALQLLTTQGERGWWHMLDLGSTMTLEAWDPKFKGNLTWNHAWGAAPANIISRFIVGVRPLTPGYGKILVAPRPGNLNSFEAKVPTTHGPILVKYKKTPSLTLDVELPKGTFARVSLPTTGLLLKKKGQIFMDEKSTPFTTEDNALVVENVGPGKHSFKVH